MRVKRIILALFGLGSQVARQAVSTEVQKRLFELGVVWVRPAQEKTVYRPDAPVLFVNFEDGGLAQLTYGTYYTAESLEKHGSYTNDPLYRAENDVEMFLSQVAHQIGLSKPKTLAYRGDVQVTCSPNGGISIDATKLLNEAQEWAKVQSQILFPK